MARSPSEITRALRVRADEVQLGRVLAKVCSSDNDCAQAFVEALRQAAAQDREIGHRAEALKIPKGIACASERGFTRSSPGAVSRHRKLGRFDLHFTGPDFALVCELKINSTYQPGQLEDYLSSGAYVVGIVRRPTSKLRKKVLGNDCWLGEVTWRQIEAGLKALPLPGKKDREQWLDLLAVMEKDGDFAADKPSGSDETDREFADAIATGVLRRLKRRLGSDPKGRKFARGFSVDGSSMRRSRAYAWITHEEAGLCWSIGVRQAHTRTPQISVDWHPWNERGSEAEQAHLHRLLEGQGFVRRGKTLRTRYFRFEGELKPAAPGIDRTRAATDCAWKAVRGVVEVSTSQRSSGSWFGLLQADIDEYSAG